MIERHGTDRRSLGQRISAARTRVGISQAEPAKRIAIRPDHVDRIERGATACTPGLLAQIAVKLGVPYRELRGGGPVP